MASTNPIHLNNKGASLLSKGNIVEAADALKQALKLTRDIIQRSGDDDSSCDEFQGELTSSDSLCPSGFDQWTSDAVSPDIHSFLVYKVPAMIQANQDVSINSISATILYNLALSQHMKFLSGSGEGTELTTVARLYEHTYCLLCKETSDDRFLSLAVMNNLAHVQFKLNNARDAERLCGLLWEAVVQVENDGDKDNQTSAFDGFFTNVIGATLKQIQSAPAA